MNIIRMLYPRLDLRPLRRLRPDLRLYTNPLPQALLCLTSLPRARLYLTNRPRDLRYLTSLPQSPRYLTSLRLCLRGSGGEDSPLLPRPWRLLLSVTPTLPTRELPRLPHLPLTNPRPCRSG